MWGGGGGRASARARASVPLEGTGNAQVMLRARSRVRVRDRARGRFRVAAHVDQGGFAPLYNRLDICAGGRGMATARARASVPLQGTVEAQVILNVRRCGRWRDRASCGFRDAAHGDQGDFAPLYNRLDTCPGRCMATARARASLPLQVRV